MTASPVPAPGRRYTSAELQDAIDTVAGFIVEYGEVYLPIFERLERELDGAIARELTLDRVKLRSKNAQPTRNKRVTTAGVPSESFPLSV